jgi:hypothetical protein
VARAPRLAIWALQALTATVIVSVVLAGPTVAVPTVPVGGSLAEVLQAGVMAYSPVDERAHVSRTGGDATVEDRAADLQQPLNVQTPLPPYGRVAVPRMWVMRGERGEKAKPKRSMRSMVNPAARMAASVSRLGWQPPAARRHSGVMASSSNAAQRRGERTCS